jgi:hypothetical protein
MSLIMEQPEAGAEVPLTTEYVAPIVMMTGQSGDMVGRQYM